MLLFLSILRKTTRDGDVFKPTFEVTVKEQKF